MPKPYTTETFVKKLNDKYGDKYTNEYNTNNLIYKKSNEKINIECDKGHLFSMRPNDLLSGHGCKECAKLESSVRQSSNKEDFIIKAEEKHGKLYGYSDVDYVNCETKVIIICKIHGQFQQTPHKHLCGSGCNDCGIILVHNLQKKSQEDFITQAEKKHGELYRYSKVEYVNNKTDVIIICKIHDDFSQNPTNHLNGSGCPLCVNKTEGKLYEKINNIYNTLITQFTPYWIKPKRFDFCITELKIIIELDGRQHFQQVSNWSSPEEQFENDKYKEKCANENGYSVIRLLQEDVFNDIYDWNKELCEAIENIKNNNDPKNVYLCKNNEYKDYN